MEQQQLIQSAINISEGRNKAVVDLLAHAADGTPDVEAVDYSADPDHNRMVLTLIGSPTSLVSAILKVCAAAIQNLDIRRHEGAHPRLGVVDVIPFAPVANISLAECAAIAVDAAKNIAETFQTPVFLYEESSPAGHTLPQVRKSAFIDIAPDFGPALPHVTAGAVVVGGRAPLIAFNVNLASDDPALAKRIAVQVRRRYPDRVRALGLLLKSRSLAQVSMNIIRPEEVSLVELVAFIAEQAPVKETELIGAMPYSVAMDTIRRSLNLDRLSPGQVLPRKSRAPRPPLMGEESE